MTSFVSSPDKASTVSPGGAVPGHLMFLRWLFAASSVLSTVVLALYSILNPTPLHVTKGVLAIAVNANANPLVNQLHLACGVALSFLLPVWYLGMAWLALRQTPWLAIFAGLLALAGWIPWSALIGQEALTYSMAQMGSSAQFAALWEHYNGSGVLTAYLLIYIIGHLLSAVLLGIALGRAHVVPVWAAWALALTSPLQIMAFIVHQLGVILVTVLFWLISSLPIALAFLRGGDDQRTRTRA
jgi:hypothetical protein